jgi:hypothetical protein
MLFLRYVGTDPAAFAQVVRPHEDRRRHHGPAGQARLPVFQVHVRRAGEAEDRAPLDKIHDAILKRGKKIAKDPDLQRLVKQNSTEVKEIMLQLDGSRRRCSAPSCRRSWRARRAT